MLEEELQIREAKMRIDSQARLDESVTLASVLGAWWVAQKFVVGVCGMAFWASKLIKVVFEKAGKPDVAKHFEEAGHHIHHLEDSWLKYTAFPLPVQYAAYATIQKVLTDDEAVSYEDFKKDKELQSTAFKALKFALLLPMALEALEHLAHSFHGVLEAFHGVTHTGSEVASAATTARSVVSAGS